MYRLLAATNACERVCFILDLGRSQTNPNPVLITQLILLAEGRGSSSIDGSSTNILRSRAPRVLLRKQKPIVSFA